MMKKIVSILLCLLLLLPCSVAVNAADTPAQVVDEAGLFTAEECSALEQKAAAVRENYEMDVVILTVNSLGGQYAQSYADDYYDENGYGVGEDYSGLLFLLAMEEREWYVSTCGQAIYAVSDYDIDAIFSKMSSDLSAGNYYEAFDTYLDVLPNYLSSDRLTSYSGNDAPPSAYYPEKQEQTVRREFGFNQFLISLVIGLIAAGIVIFFMCRAMNTARSQHGAGDYLRKGSYKLNVQRDIFLYSHVSKRRKPEDNGGSRGGGGSVHRSSSGRSHGGHGGKF